MGGHVHIYSETGVRSWRLVLVPATNRFCLRRSQIPSKRVPHTTAHSLELHSQRERQSQPLEACVALNKGRASDRVHVGNFLRKERPSDTAQQRQRCRQPPGRNQVAHVQGQQDILLRDPPALQSARCSGCCPQTPPPDPSPTRECQFVEPQRMMLIGQIPKDACLIPF